MPEVEMKKLKEAIAAINDSGEIEPAITVVGTSDEDLITLFTDAVEALNEAGRDVPAVAIEVYNAMYSEPEEEEPEEEEPEEEPAKKPVAAKKSTTKKAAKKKPEKKKKAATTKKATVKPKAVEKKPAVVKKAAAKPKSDKKSNVKRDDFGFTVGSKANLFVKSINNKTGKTMAEVKELDWNDKNATFYDTFHRLEEKGLAEKDDKGKMKIIKK